MKATNRVDRTDGFAKSRRKSIFVIPVKTGIQEYQILKNYLDPGFRREFYERGEAHKAY
jgi:hypothetical protein